MYSFGLLKPTGTFQSAGVSGAANAHGNSRIFPTIPASISKISAAHGQPGGMSVIFVILVVAVISVSIFFGFREFFKYAFIGAEEKKKSEDPSGADDEKPEENRDFTGTPRQTVLFYYGLLRGRIGNPSSTPYEFREELEKFIGDRAGRLTEIFVKLRYRGIEISEEEANIVKKEVSKLIG